MTLYSKKFEWRLEKISKVSRSLRSEQDIRHIFFKKQNRELNTYILQYIAQEGLSDTVCAVYDWGHRGDDFFDSVNKKTKLPKNKVSGTSLYKVES